MKNGFTLIELLVVIVIVGILSTIAYVTIDKSIKDSRNNLYNVQLNQIYDGTESWVFDNITKLENKQVYCVKLGTLEDEGYVEKGIINPKTDKKFNADLYIKITQNISGYDYLLVENNDGCE